MLLVLPPKFWYLDLDVLDEPSQERKEFLASNRNVYIRMFRWNEAKSKTESCWKLPVYFSMLLYLVLCSMECCSPHLQGTEGSWWCEWLHLKPWDQTWEFARSSHACRPFPGREHEINPCNAIIHSHFPKQRNYLMCLLEARKDFFVILSCHFCNRLPVQFSNIWIFVV